MCGIFGHIGGEIAKDLAVVCTDSMAHRGPDGGGIWQSDGVTLGHRRLAILDLSEHGKQPMTSLDGRYCLTYNGEIYNFIELRRELETLGHRFFSQTDTEIVIAAFREWGHGCVDKFNGMWAFAIWDSRERRLFLSRDRFGKKPLFYAFLPTGFAFASEMKALFPLLDEVRANVELVKDNRQIFQYEATGECVIQGIKRFPAGHYGCFKEGHLAINRYWCTLDNLVEVPRDYGAQVEQFRELFVDACRLRMRSDVPIGTALSGGLDSSATISAVAHIARSRSGGRLSTDWQHAFVASFPGTPLDETDSARMVTDNLGIEATFLDIDPLKVIDRLDEYFYMFEELYITSPIPFMMTYGAMKDSGVKVTIDGHGADECFGGYPFDIVAAFSDVWLHSGPTHMVLKTLRDMCPDGFGRLRGRLPGLGPELRLYFVHLVRKLLRRGLVNSRDCRHPEYRRLDHLSRQLYVSAHETVLPTILRNYDRYSMANGVEIRMPFMDHRIVSFAFSLPWSSKLRNGFSKAIIRDGVVDLMPAEVAYRKSKIGFNSPIVDWMKGPLRDFFQDIIHSRDFKDSALIDSGVVAAKIDKVITDPGASFADGEKAWTMLSPYLWEKAVIKRNYSRGSLG